MVEAEQLHELAMAEGVLNEAAQQSEAAMLRAIANGELREYGRGPELVRLAEVLGDYFALSSELDQRRD